MAKLENNFGISIGDRESTAWSEGRNFDLKIDLLGGFSLKLGGKAISVANRKACALLGYLASKEGRSASRQQLVGLLWSEVSEDRARASLRQTVRRLRLAFDEVALPGLSADRNEIALAPAERDVDRIRDGLDKGRVDPALLQAEHVAQEFMSGFEEVDPAFRSWLVVQRETLSQRLIRQLTDLIETPRLAEDGTGKEAAVALSLLEPTNEIACRHLIRLAAREGDVATALGHYNKLWSLLEDEYDAEPSQKTIDLIAAVKLGEIGPAGADPPSAPQTGRALGNKSKLVLQISETEYSFLDDEQSHICRGFRSELFATLVKFREWTVIDKAALPMGALEKADRVVDYELTGQFTKVGDTLCFTCQLTDCMTGNLVWSERFQFEQENFFTSQRDVVHRINFSLNVHISQERLQKVANQPDISLDIYDRWLRGQAYFLKWSPDSRSRATRIFRSIIEDEPTFARAYSSLVSLYNSDHFVFPGVIRSADASSRALEFARKAVDLDPLDARSQLHLGWAQAMSGEFDIAQITFGLACALNENDPWTAASAAGGFAYSGMPEAGREWSEKALKLAIAPVPMVWAYTSVVRYINEDYAGCVLAATQSENDIMIMRAWRAAALWRLGRPEEARRQCERFFEVIRKNWFGAGPPTQDTIIDWAVGCFPIRSKAVLNDFRFGLNASATEA